jgi:hypothetical protein
MSNRTMHASQQQKIHHHIIIALQQSKTSQPYQACTSNVTTIQTLASTPHIFLFNTLHQSPDHICLHNKEQAALQGGMSKQRVSVCPSRPVFVCFSSGCFVHLLSWDILDMLVSTVNRKARADKYVMTANNQAAVWCLLSCQHGLLATMHVFVNY